MAGTMSSAVRKPSSPTARSNGSLCDLVIVVAKTDPGKGAKGISLLVVDTTMPGFTKGKRLKKIGMKAQDTGVLFFDDVRVPVGNLLGDENQGFAYLMQELPWERLQIAISAVAQAEAAIGWASRYCRERKAFGQEIMNFQNTRFTLAEAMTEVQIARVFVDRCIELHIKGELDATAASMAKYWWPSTGAPSCKARFSTPACSCMGATAICGNTRSPAPGRMRGWRASTEAATKS